MIILFFEFQFLGIWYVVEYYASSEEALAYRCMKAELSVSSENDEVTMNFTYSFVDDPINEQLIGNITWKIPSPDLPAHWVHAEEPCKNFLINHSQYITCINIIDFHLLSNFAKFIYFCIF